MGDKKYDWEYKEMKWVIRKVEGEDRVGLLYIKSEVSVMI